MGSNINTIIYIFYKNLIIMKKRVIKVILLSSIILGYSLVLQYPVAHEYYVLVEPYNHGSSDLVINLANVENIAKRIAYNITNNNTILTISLNKSILIKYIFKNINNSFGYVDYAVVGIDSNKRLILINSPDEVRLLPVFIVEGQTLKTCDEALFYFINNYNYKVGDRILIDHEQKRIVGLFSAGPILGGGNLIDDYAISCGNPYSLANVLIFIDIKKNISTSGIDNLKVNIYSEILHDIFKININKSKIIKMLPQYGGDIVDIKKVKNETYRIFKEEYGLKTQWGIFLIISIIIYIAYLIRVSLSDVGEELRELVALLYSQGALDSHVSLLLLLQTLTYVVASLFLGIIIGYEFMRFSLGAYLPFKLTLMWLSKIFIIGIILSSILSLIAGLYSVRRTGLSTILRGG